MYRSCCSSLGVSFVARLVIHILLCHGWISDSLLTRTKITFILIMLQGLTKELVNLQIGWDSVMRMSVDLRDLFLYEAFLYYNPLLLVVSYGFLFRIHYLIILPNTFSLYWYILLWFWYVQTMMVWFWGINLWVFAQSQVSYPKIFELDQNHLTHREIWKVPTFIGSLLINHHELISVILYLLMLLSCFTFIFRLYTTKIYTA